MKFGSLTFKICERCFHLLWGSQCGSGARHGCLQMLGEFFLLDPPAATELSWAELCSKAFWAVLPSTGEELPCLSSPHQCKISVPLSQSEDWYYVRQDGRKEELFPTVPWKAAALISHSILLSINSVCSEIWPLRQEAKLNWYLLLFQASVTLQDA